MADDARLGWHLVPPVVSPAGLSDGDLFASSSLLPRWAVGDSVLATTGIISPTEVIAGTSQQTSALTDSGAFGGSLLLKSTGNATGDGGALLFGVNVGHMRHFGGFKGLGTSGSNNTAGDVALALRYLDSDAGLTEVMKWAHTGDVRLSRAQVVSNLQTCNADYEGYVSRVTDANTATWGATPSGGGSNKVLLYCDGSNWTVMAK